MYDRDGSGFITPEEIQKWMNGHGRRMCQSEAKLMISTFDDDKNGQIDYTEFLLVVCRRVLRDKSIEYF